MLRQSCRFLKHAALGVRAECLLVASVVGALRRARYGQQKERPQISPRPLSFSVSCTVT